MTQALYQITICPAEIARVNRQARNRLRERNPAVRALVKAWCIGKICSCGCGRPATTAHHPTDDLYESDIRYLNLSQCEPYYHHCHYMRHRGFERCPACNGWMRQGSEKCAKCRGWRHKNKRKIVHPCAKNLGQQRCAQKGVCCYSPRKAGECRAFMNVKWVRP